MWNSESLHKLVETRLKGFRLICVSNREPYIHVRGPSGIRCVEPASGVVSALDPVMRATGGVWIAHGSGSADRETADARGRLRVPPDRGLYTLRRLWLSPEEERGYYYGFANEGLWPLCHIAYQRPVFEQSHFDQYEAVNARFADAVVEEAGDERALVFVNDYHYALLPKMVKERLPSAVVFQFWHIPWPNPEAFRILPWKARILEGLLANDLLSFHIQHHCNNFMETVDRELECRVDREKFTIFYKGSPTLIRPRPIGVDFDRLDAECSAPEAAEAVRTFRKEFRLEGVRVLLGVDRLDYTKGIPERLQAFDRLLARHPERRGRVSLVQVGVPTRSTLPAYTRLETEVDGLIREINHRHGRPGWAPVIYLKENLARARLLPLFRLADLCLVTSLHDGMNLVAKEFVACRGDERGVLVLSPFTGAARELDAAVRANPYAVDELAEILHRSLDMPEEEQAARMRKLRESVREDNVFAWVGRLLEAAARLEPA